MQRFLVVCSLLLGACAGDSPETSSGEFGSTCSVVVDTGSTECDSGVCTNSFDMIGHPVCSQTCTYGMNDTCPAGSTGAKMCNMKGYCRP